MKTKNAIGIVYYSAENEPYDERLQRVIGRIFPRKKIEICRSCRALSERLGEPSMRPFIVVILAATREELSSLLVLRELLLDRRIILVLPDDEPETTSKGHVLRPRFITYKNSDYGDVSVVLKKMISNYEWDFRLNGSRSSRLAVDRKPKEESYGK